MSGSTSTIDDFDSEHRLVIVTIRGDLTDEDLLEGHDRLTRDPRYHPDYSQLVDLRGASEVAVSPRGVRRSAVSKIG